MRFVQISIINLLSTVFLFSCQSKKPVAILSNPFPAIDTVTAGQSKTAHITVKNLGNAVLKIDKFVCSCECTVPELSENTKILPNDSLRIKFTINGFDNDKGKWKQVLCTFKTNADSMFLRLNFNYYTKE